MDVTDPLTGLYTSPRFRESLSKVMGEADTLTLALLDVDRFAEFNHEHGHEAGDHLLAALGTRLRALAEEARGFAGRIGGDEFGIVLPGAPLETGFLRMERFRADVAESNGFPVPQVPDYRFSLSIGVANFPRDARAADELMKRADQALWSGKEAGRNQVALPSEEEMVLKSCYYTSTQVGRLRRLAETQKRKESMLLREALDDLLRKYDVKYEVK